MSRISIDRSNANCHNNSQHAARVNGMRREEWFQWLVQGRCKARLSLKKTEIIEATTSSISPSVIFIEYNYYASAALLAIDQRNVQ